MDEKPLDQMNDEKEVSQEPVIEHTSHATSLIQHTNERDIVWPIFLIFIGSMFLLNTTGLVSWNVWGVMWRFWPVFIIFAGLQLMFGKGKIGSWIIGLIALILFIIVGVTALSIIDSPLLERFNINIPDRWQDIVENKGEQKTTKLTIDSSKYDDIENLNLSLDLGLGKLMVVDEKSDNIMSLDATYYENWGEPKLEEEEKDSSLKVEFSQDHDGSVFGFNNNSPEYELTLGQEKLPVLIVLDVGAGEGIMDLDSVPVTEIDGDVGAGRLEMTFSEKSIPSHMKLNVGAGAIEINLPASVGYSINYSVGVGEISSREDSVGGIGSDGIDWKSENFDEAEVTLTIDANVGAGKITIK